MAAPQYWLDLFTGKTWNEFLASGATVSGFRESRWATVQKIHPGDFLICYLTGVSRFIGILEVTSEAFQEETKIWTDEAFPCRLKVKPTITLEPETAVPVKSLQGSLSMFQNQKSNSAWTGRFRGSPSQWNKNDGKVVAAALEEAERNPIRRSVDLAKLNRRPKSLKTKIGVVTIPDDSPSVEEGTHLEEKVSEHTHVQSLLLKLGAEMGFSVWVARNDRGRVVNGKSLSQFSKVLERLPLQFDEASTKTIELIDVLWLQGNTIVAAFEIECTTSIYSGLLRMSDLLAMQPNLNIPLYLVAPDERRNKVFEEVNRPTFAQFNTPLSQVCRFISLSQLNKELKKVASFIQYLKPEFLDELSESCEAEYS